MLTLFCALVAGGIAGMVFTALAIWQVTDKRDIEQNAELLRRQQRIADLEVEVERLDGACIELRVENSWLRGSSDGPEAA